MKRHLHSMRTTGFVVLFVVLAVVLPRNVRAAICTTNGAGSSWNTADNWDCGYVPGVTPNTGDDVVIAHNMTLDIAPTVGSLTINSGMTLTAASDKDLTVTGDWNNNGNFVHNSSKVTLGGTGGTETVTGSTTFYQLYTSGSAVKNFDSASITIEERFQHDGGSMTAGTSTFTFHGETSIRGGNQKQFYNLIIDGALVQHTADDIRISGDLTILDGKRFAYTGVSSKRVIFDGDSAQNITLGTSATIRFPTLIIEDKTKGNVIVIFPTDDSGGITAATVTNEGVLQEKRTSVSGSTTFLRIQDDAATPLIQYEGMLVLPGSGSPDITLSIAGNQSVCNNPNGGLYRDRCFRLNSSAAAAGFSVTLYSTTGEDDIDNDAFYEYSNGSWINRAACADVVNGGGSCPATVNLLAGDNYFLIGSSVNPPTPVVLSDFQATPVETGVTVNWQTAVEIDFAGFYVWRGEQESGPFERISPLIPATGGLNGASYHYSDSLPAGDQDYFYRLEAVDLDNSTEFFEPIVRAARSGAGTSTSRLFLPITVR